MLRDHPFGGVPRLGPESVPFPFAELVGVDLPGLDGRGHERELCVDLGALEPVRVGGVVLVEGDFVEESFGFSVVLGAAFRHVGSVPRRARVGHGRGRLRRATRIYALGGLTGRDQLRRISGATSATTGRTGS